MKERTYEATANSNLNSVTPAQSAGVPAAVGLTVELVDDDDDQIDNLKYMCVKVEDVTDDDDDEAPDATGPPANSAVDATGPSATHMFPPELAQDDVDAYVEEPVHQYPRRERKEVKFTQFDHSNKRYDAPNVNGILHINVGDEPSKDNLSLRTSRRWSMIWGWH